MSLQQFNSIGDIRSAISALDLTKIRSKAEMNELALSLIPDPIRDIERAIDPLYDFRKYGLDLGLNLSEGKKKRKRESPEFRDDRLYAWEKVKTWKDKDFKRQFRVSRSLFNKIVSRIINIYPGNSPTGKENYDTALRKGDNATPWGPIIMEVKVLVFLRLLAGGSAYDMYWYGANALTSNV